MTIETWGFNVSTSKGKLRYVRSLPRSSRSPLRAITYAIVTQLAQAGFSENQLAEGNGEALTTYSDQLVINELMAVAGVKSHGGRSLWRRRPG
jgi:Protein of unknown function (DUF4043)